MSKLSKLSLTVLAFATVFLITSTPIAASTNVALSMPSPADYEDSFNLEFVDITAGLGSAALVSVVVYGGSDGSSYPTGIDPMASGFAEAYGWNVMATDQGDYSAYLNTPAVQAPENVSLVIVYPSSYTANAAFSLALTAKAAVESTYGITMYLTYVNTAVGNYFQFSGGSEAELADIANDVADFSSAGFAGLIDASALTAAPLMVAAYGARTIGSNIISFHGALWIDDNGVATGGVVETSAERSISTNAIFGADVNPLSDFGLSRVRINIPYPVSPLAIYPAETSNPLPHVTGRIIWDLRHPIADYTLGSSASDYGVDFDIGMERTFPMVENKLTIDQAKLNQEGTLEFDFDLTNVGQAEARNVELSFPVGPDFQEIASKNITIYRLQEDVTLNEAFSAGYNISLSYDLSAVPDAFKSAVLAALPQELNFEFLNLDGWYESNSTSDILFFNSTTQLVLFDESISVSGQSVGATLLIDSPEGIPQMAIDAINTFIVPVIEDAVAGGVDSTTVTEISDGVKAALPDVLKFTFNETLANAYEPVQIFKVNDGDFTRVQKNVGIDAATAQMEWFLEADVESLPAGDSTTLSWSVENVPKETDNFQTINFIKDTDTNGFPSVTLESKLQSYADLMRYTLAVFDYHGRPLSYQFGGGPVANLALDQVSVDSFLSIGMAFTWENANGFKFFGLSNGQNLQVGDNEAVLTTTVNFKDNAQVFEVGDDVTIEVEVTNNGDSEATDVAVHLYHAALGRGNQFEYVQRFHSTTIDNIAAGATETYEVTVVANSFIGYHPVFAITEFTSDAGEGATPVTDFFDLGVTEWRYGGEARHITTSTLTGGLLLPAVQAAAPAVPEPQITFSTGLSISATGFTYTLTAENTGDAETTVFITQTFSTAEVNLESFASNKGTIDSSSTVGGVGLVTVSEVTLAPGESVVITLDFTFVGDSAYIPPATAVYQTPGESSLGDRASTNPEGDSGGDSLSLEASASAQEAAQESATESGEYSAYSGGAAVGAYAGGVGTESNTDVEAPPSFIGFGPMVAFALLVIPLTGAGIYRRKFN